MITPESILEAAVENISLPPVSSATSRFLGSEKVKEELQAVARDVLKATEGFFPEGADKELVEVVATLTTQSMVLETLVEALLQAPEELEDEALDQPGEREGHEV